MFHRGSAFTHGGIAQMAQEYLSSYKFSTFRERLEQKQLTKLQSPFVEDGFAIYSLIQDFVSRYVLNYYGGKRPIQVFCFSSFTELGKTSFFDPPNLFVLIFFSCRTTPVG